MRVNFYFLLSRVTEEGYSIFHVYVVHIFSTSAEKMKAYSIEYRKKIVKAYEQGDTS